MLQIAFFGDIFSKSVVHIAGFRVFRGMSAVFSTETQKSGAFSRSSPV
jgi:hypothetical protein